MRYCDFLTMVIDGGIEGARRDYAHDMFKRDGAVAGFEACRGKHPGDLAVLLEQAHEETEEIRTRKRSGLGSGTGEYWFARCFELEIGFVVNCVAAAFGVVDLRRRIELPSPFVEWLNPPAPFTARGAMRAANVLGIGAALAPTEF